MAKERLAYIDYWTHQYTNSGNFLRKILSEEFEIVDFWWKPNEKIPMEEIDKFEFNIQIPSSQTSIKDQYKKLSENINFFDFIDDLKFYDYNLIFSRCGSGSMFEILYYTDKVFFVPHLHSRDLHQKFNKMFFINKLKIKDEIPNHDNFKILPNFYFNQFINPYSIHKISSFISN